MTSIDLSVGLTVPSKRLEKLSKSTVSKFKINWDITNRVNYFHKTCYDSTDINGVEERLLRAAENSLEQFDVIETTVKESICEVAKLMKESKNIVCFTGAGVSVNAGLATYRGTEGIDTLDELSKRTANNVVVDLTDDVHATKKAKTGDQLEEEDEEEEEVDYTTLEPTLTHNALARLHIANMMSYCVTQNCDNLHHKGGFPRIALSELHGNVFVEYCEECKTEYERDYCVDLYSTDCRNESWYVECPHCHWNHYTGRKYSKKRCKGKLKDTIVNFGDDLFDDILGGLPRAIDKCSNADLCLCLGTSLTVSPANTLPVKAKNLVIVNLQATDLDDKADYRFYCSTDIFSNYSWRN